MVGGAADRGEECVALFDLVVEVREVRPRRDGHAALLGSLQPLGHLGLRAWQEQGIGARVERQRVGPTTTRITSAGSGAPLWRSS